MLFTIFSEQEVRKLLRVWEDQRQDSWVVSIQLFNTSSFPVCSLSWNVLIPQRIKRCKDIYFIHQKTGKILLNYIVAIWGIWIINVLDQGGQNITLNRVEFIDTGAPT